LHLSRQSRKDLIDGILLQPSTHFLQLSSLLEPLRKPERTFKALILMGLICFFDILFSPSKI